MRKPILPATIFFGVLLLASASSMSDPGVDTAGDEPLEMADSQPATEPLGPNPSKDPFVPFASDPGAWWYDDLSPAERQGIDRMITDDDQAKAVNDIYGAALAEQFDRAKSEYAQLRLGLEELGSIGVVE